MGRLPIRLYGDPVLKARAERVERVTDELRQLAADMFETMEAARGVGLAANQVGVLRRVLVVAVPGAREGDPPFRVALINPEVLEISGEQNGEEGCLSFPGLYFDVKRPLRCVLTATGLDGEPLQLEAEGFLARALLHEMDHLDGVLYVDRISTVRRGLLRGRLDEIRTRGTAGLTRGEAE